MPSQISHMLFAEDVLDRALGGTGKTLLKRHGPLFRFGAQGPDFFYHNKRTRPTGIKYGLATHKEGYGRVVKNMLIEAQHLRRRGMKPRSFKRIAKVKTGADQRNRSESVVFAVIGDITPRGLCFRNEIPPGAAMTALRDLVRAQETRLWKETGGAAGTCSSPGAGRETD